MRTDSDAACTNDSDMAGGERAPLDDLANFDAWSDAHTATRTFGKQLVRCPHSPPVHRLKVGYELGTGFHSRVCLVDAPGFARVSHGRHALHSLRCVAKTARVPCNHFGHAVERCAPNYITAGKTEGEETTQQL